MLVVASVLGPVRIVAGVDELHLGGRLTRRLLLRLLLADGLPVSGAELIDAIWNEPASGEALRVQVNRLRRLLQTSELRVLTGPRGWSLDRTTYRDTRDEVLEIMAQLKFPQDPTTAVGLCTRGLSIWMGPTLREVSDEPWAEGEAARLNQVRETLRQIRAEALASSGSLSDALAEFVAAREHPFDERNSAWVAACLAQLGRNRESLKVLRTLRIRVRAEMSADISELPALVERLVLRGEVDIVSQLPLLSPFDLRRTPATIPTPPALPSIGLVGRKAEWNQLVEEGSGQSGSRQHVIEPRFRTVVVTGDQGAGKTTLVDAFVRHRLQEGAVVLRGAFRNYSAVPHEALAEAISTATDPIVTIAIRSSQTLSALSSELLKSGDVEEMRPEQVGVAFGNLVHQLSMKAPAVLVIEDAHWATKSTLAALSRIVSANRIGMVNSIDIVITSRSDDVSPAGLQELVSTTKSPNTVTISLPALGLAEIKELLALAGRSTTDDLVNAINKLTDGNAFLVNEVVAHFTDDALLTLRHQPFGRMRGRRGLPTLIDAALTGRINDLSEHGRLVVSIVSCYRAPMPFAVLVRVLSELDEGDIYSGIDETLLGGLLAEDAANGFLRPRHALYEFAVLATLSPTQRERIHHQIVKALVHGVHDPSVGAFEVGQIPIRTASLVSPAFVAEHLVAAGGFVEPRELARWLLRASEHALANGALDSATTAVNRAIELLEGFRPVTAELTGALLLRQLVASNSGDTKVSKATGHRIVAMAVAANDLQAAAQAVVRHCSYGRDQREDPESLALADVVIERTAAHPVARVRALAAKGFHCSMWLGDAVQGRQLAIGAGALARETGDSTAIGEAAFAVGTAQLGRPSLGELDAAIAELRRNGLASGRTVDIVRSWRLEGLAAIQRGDLVALQWSIAELERLGNEPGQWHVLADIARWRSSLAHCEGRFADAENYRLEQRERGFGGAAFEASAAAQEGLQHESLGRLRSDHVMFPILLSNRTAWIAVEALLARRQLDDLSSAQATTRLTELVEALGPLETNRNRLCDLVSLVIFAESMADLGHDVGDSVALLHAWLDPYAGLIAFAGYGEHFFGSVHRYLGITSSLLADECESQRQFELANRQEQRNSWIRALAETWSAKLRAVRRAGADDASAAESMLHAWSALGVTL